MQIIPFLFFSSSVLEAGVLQSIKIRLIACCVCKMCVAIRRSSFSSVDLPCFPLNPEGRGKWLNQGGQV